MATKSGILAIINGFITAIITPSKHRSSMSTLVDEIYPSSVTDSQSTETYTTKTATDILYTIYVIKSGNIAHIRGQIRNNSSSFGVNTPIFTWKSNQFKPKTTVSVSYFYAYNSSSQVRLKLDENGLTVFNDGLVNGQDLNFDFTTYITQD